MPANVVCIIVAWGKLSAVAGHHSFRAVRSWEFKTVSVDGLGSGLGKW